MYLITLVLISENERLVSWRVELKSFAKLVEDEFIGCISPAECSISDWNWERTYSEFKITWCSMCITMAYQHDVNERRTNNAEYACNTCLRLINNKCMLRKININNWCYLYLIQKSNWMVFFCISFYCISKNFTLLKKSKKSC